MGVRTISKQNSIIRFKESSLVYIFFIFFILFLLQNDFISAQTSSTDLNLTECINEKYRLYTSIEKYSSGFVMVVFDKGIIEKDAIELLESLKLSVHKNRFNSTTPRITANSSERVIANFSKDSYELGL